MSSPENSDVLVRVENVGKKFCRSLKKSLWYGITDIATVLNPFSRASDQALNHQLSALNSSGTLPSSHLRSSISDPLSPPGLPNLRADEFWAVENVSFELRRGECLGLIGHNGAGKSTLLKILNGLIPPDTGRITMRGRVAALIELNAGFNPILSGRENIFNQAALLGFSKYETLAKFDAIVDFAEIGDFLDMPVQNYSSGMKVRLGFAVAAQMEPDVLLLDEVLAVGDAAFRHKCLTKMHEILQKAAVIFVSHSMPQIYRSCSHILLLERGQTRFCGDSVGNGIEQYFSAISAREFVRTGTERVDLLDFRTLSAAQSADTSNSINLKHGDPLTVRFKLKLDSSIKKIGLKISLWNTELIPVCDVVSQTVDNFIVETDIDSCPSIEVNIAELLLSSGAYYLTIVVSDESFSLIYARLENVAKIVVLAPYPTGAATIIPADWSLSP